MWERLGDGGSPLRYLGPDGNEIIEDHLDNETDEGIPRVWLKPSPYVRAESGRLHEPDCGAESVGHSCDCESLIMANALSLKRRFR